MSAKLPPFAGRCSGRQLTYRTHNAAATALTLATWRSLSPEQCRAGIERNLGRMLVCLLLLLALTAGCRTAQAPGTEAERAQPSIHPQPFQPRA